MNSEIHAQILEVEGIEYAIFDAEGVLQDHSPGLKAQLLNFKSTGDLIGFRLQKIFPELLGYDRILEQIQKGQLDELRLNNIHRDKEGDGPGYINLYVGLWQAGWLVILRRADLEGEMEQRLQGQRNEVRLLAAVLEEKEARLQAFLHALPDLVLIMDEHGRYIEVLTSNNKLLIKESQALVGRTLHDVLPPDRADRFLIAVHKALAESALQVIEYELEVMGGAFWFEAYIAPILPDIGSQKMVVWVVRDITERKAVETLKGEFVSMVSHELRTPLTTIKGFTEMVLEGNAGEINPEQQEYLSIVMSDSDRLIALINDLLDVSRIEESKIDLAIEMVDLAGLLRYVARSMESQIKHKEQNLTLVIEDNLPRIPGDYNRLVQVFTNLISNAHKYTPQGGEIRVETALQKDGIQVDVEDNGIGISLDDQERLFTRFFRADNSLTRSVGGTGLGLTIVRSLVMLHGGSIDVKSQAGKGSTFTIKLPLS